MRRRFGIMFALLITGGHDMVLAQDRTVTLPGSASSATEPWRPALLLREQTSDGADRRRPVVYIHGATFPSANSMMFRFDGVSWADALNKAGRSVWALDFAGFGGSEFYPRWRSRHRRLASRSAAHPRPRLRLNVPFARLSPRRARPASRSSLIRGVPWRRVCSPHNIQN